MNFNESFGSLLGLGFLASIFVTYFIFIIALYVYFAVVLQKIAKKLKMEDDWWAWVPILNLILMLRMGNQSGWWALTLLVPWLGQLAFVIVSVIAWMKICKKFGKPDWLGILMIVPIANLILPGYLAFGSEVLSNSSTTAP